MIYINGFHLHLHFEDSHLLKMHPTLFILVNAVYRVPHMHTLPICTALQYTWGWSIVFITC